MMFNVYSMFAGIGGFDLGLEATGGFVTVMQSEIEKYPQSILRQHWPDALQVGDCTVADYSKFDVSVDVICGGFPCQDISIAGKQTGITGSRSSLFGEMIRAANFYEPKYLIFENVRRLLSINHGRDFDYVLQEISGAGYDAEWRVCSANEVGAPHQRDRLFIVAWRRDMANSDKRGCFTGSLATKSGQREKARQPASTSQAGKGLANSGGVGCNKGEYATELREGTARQHSESCMEYEAGTCKELGYSGGERLQGREFESECGQATLWDTERYQVFTRPPKRSDYWDGAIRYRNRLVEPTIHLLVDGVSNRSHQIKAYGNAIVPQVAEYVGQMVLEHWKRRNDSKHERGRVA